MQQIFAASLRLPYFWHALPFFVAAVSVREFRKSWAVGLTFSQALYALAGVSTSFLRIEKTADDSVEGIVADGREQDTT